MLAVVLDGDRSVLGRARVRTRRGPEGVVGSATDAVRQALAKAGATPSDLVATGVGVPGLVQPGSGAVSHAVNLELGADPVDLAAHLAAALGAPAVVENDVNAAALGAWRLRGTPGDLALLSIGTGLAAGLVVGGHLHRGARGAAGEIGHVPVDPAGAWCPCGQRGCLETLASGAALAAAWPLVDGTPTAWQAAADGDEKAAEVVADFARGVADAVRLLVLTWDVETVVLAGGVTEVGQPLLSAVHRELQSAQQGSRFLAALDLPHRVELLPPGSPVAAVGAALLARDAQESRDAAGSAAS
ncbi:ROK family protein [Angustibacter peucedani]